MKVAILTPHLGNPWFNLGDVYIVLGIAQMLASHEIRWFELHKRPSQETIHVINQCDLLIIGGSNIIGAMGTLRVGWTKTDFEAIHIPIMPLAIGAQAEQGKKPILDARGMEILDVIASKSKMFSARDQLTQEFLLERYGADKVMLTGCSANFVACQTNATPGNIIFCPGLLFPYLSPAINIRYWRGLRYMLRKWDVNLVLAHQQESMHFSRIFRRPIVWHRGNYRQSLSEFGNCKLLITGRIHAAIVALQAGIPTVMIATDERCLSFCKTHAIPCVAWSPAVGRRALDRHVQYALSGFDKASTDLRLKNLRDEMKRYLSLYGVSCDDSMPLPNLPVPETIYANSAFVSYAITCSKRYFNLYPLMAGFYRRVLCRKPQL